MLVMGGAMALHRYRQVTQGVSRDVSRLVRFTETSMNEFLATLEVLDYWSRMVGLMLLPLVLAAGVLYILVRR